MSEIVARVAGANQVIKRVVLVQGGAAYRVFTRVVAVVAGSSQTVFMQGSTPPPATNLTASAMPGAVQGSASGSKTAKTIYTNTCMVSVTGGTAPYTYAWMLRDSDGNAQWSVANTMASSTNFRAANVPVNSETQATFVCVVTDAAGVSVTSNNVEADVMNEGLN